VIFIYYDTKIRETLRVPPNRFGEDLREVLVQIARESIEGKIDPALGIIVAVSGIDKVYRGKIVPNDGAVYYECDIDLLTYLPEINEIVEGIVIECTDFGAFCRIGTIDALCHVSQIADDYFRYVPKNGLLRGDKTKRDLIVNTRVRARIIAVNVRKTEIQVGLTMKQDALGAYEWIEEWKQSFDKKTEEEKK